MKPANAEVQGAAAPNEPMSVSIILHRRQPLNVAALHGRQLTREEFHKQHAADPKAMKILRQFAVENGLTVSEEESSLDRRTLVVHGTASQMQKAFGVTLQRYARALGPGTQAQGSPTWRGYEGAIQLPSACAPHVQAVLGLDTRPIAHTHYRRLRPGQVANVSYSPPQVAELYDFPAGADGSGQTIGIIELGGGYETSDLEKYFQNLKLTPPNVVAVSVDGGKNAPSNPQGADGEVALDIEVAGSIAPGASIAVYFTPNTDQGFVDAVSTAVHDTTNHPSVISISWGGPESSWSQQATTALDDACQSAAALGITITVACGDSGSTDGVTDGANHVDFPASSPHVLACGGTDLVGTGSTIQSEVVWNDLAQDGGATGGGVSTVFPLPTWQQNANVSTATNGGTGRGVPDIAADAAPETGYNILVDGTSEVVGGTSAVAPLWAALVALLNQQLGKQVGFLNPVLYPLLGTSAFHDITKGNNGAFSAGAGWDACSGLGSPNGSSLLSSLKET
jgi:kumamolisin